MKTPGAGTTASDGFLSKANFLLPVCCWMTDSGATKYRLMGVLAETKSNLKRVVFGVQIVRLNADYD
jgi:hypothetical protein